MKLFLIVAFAIVIVAVMVIMFFKSKKDKVLSDVIDENTGLKIEGKLAKQDSYEMTVQFDDLPALTEDEETRLVEVKNSKLLARLVLWKELLEELTAKWRIASKDRQTGWLLIIMRPIIWQSSI